MSEHHLDAASFRLYTAHATHSRAGLSKPHSTFVGDLGVVRAPLPAGCEPARVRTPHGVLDPADRLLPTLEHVRAFCAMHGSPRPARVEILTPPRVRGHRFAAMAVYLLYPSADAPSPSHFVLEAGMATGEASICYPPCAVGSWQTVSAGYRPTPFSTAEQVFRGTFAMNEDAPDEPGTLIVEAYRAPTDRAPALRVSVRYQAAAAPAAHPLWLRVMAGARIGAVAEAARQPVTLAARWLLRLVAIFLPWIEAPRGPARPSLPAPVPRL
jgi:hypothetical protein